MLSRIPQLLHFSNQDRPFRQVRGKTSDRDGHVSANVARLTHHDCEVGHLQRKTTPSATAFERIVG